MDMNAIDRIKNQLTSAPVVLYMKGTPDFPQCGFSAQTVGALRACKAKFAHVNIFEDPEGRAHRRLPHRHRDVQERRAAAAPGGSGRSPRLAGPRLGGRA